jgi:hypothetical protein
MAKHKFYLSVDMDCTVNFNRKMEVEVESPKCRDDAQADLENFLDNNEADELLDWIGCNNWRRTANFDEGDRGAFCYDIGQAGFTKIRNEHEQDDEADVQMPSLTTKEANLLLRELRKHLDGPLIQEMHVLVAMRALLKKFEAVVPQSTTKKPEGIEKRQVIIDEDGCITHWI